VTASKFGTTLPEHSILMAYLDTGAGQRADGTNQTGIRVAYESEEYVRVLSDQEVSDFMQVGYVPPIAQVTGGYITLPPSISFAAVYAPCPITKQKIDGGSYTALFDGVRTRVSSMGRDILVGEQGYIHANAFDAERCVEHLLLVPPGTATFVYGETTMLDDGPTRPCQIERLASHRFRLVLTEGRNRQIRRMIRAVGAEVANP
jgi:hypothetical protein